MKSSNFSLATHWKKRTLTEGSWLSPHFYCCFYCTLLSEKCRVFLFVSYTCQPLCVSSGSDHLPPSLHILHWPTGAALFFPALHRSARATDPILTRCLALYGTKDSLVILPLGTAELPQDLSPKEDRIVDKYSSKYLLMPNIMDFTRVIIRRSCMKTSMGEKNPPEHS